MKRPCLQGAQKCVLNAFFGQAKMGRAQHAHERAEYGGLLMAEQVIHQQSRFRGRLVHNRMHQ